MRWITGVVLALMAAPAAHAGSLPSVSSGARPGPDVLYAPQASAPQLENAAPWTAEPILVSGAEAYRTGEFLYQDFLYDDHGAVGTTDPTDPFNPLEFSFSPKHGTLTYPTDAALADNAADLVELRVKPVPGATAFRVTLNHLPDPERVAFTIALGTSPAPHLWPHGAGVASPAELFLTVHGETAELRDAATGTVRDGATARVDRRRRQVDVRVPTGAWDPGSGRVRMAAGVGLWDRAANRYLAPTRGPASATAPGGGAASGAALFNMAFRTNEPIPRISVPNTANTVFEGSVAADSDSSWWRERRQGDVLASGDVSSFAADVDFAKLRAGTADESGVPAVGHLDRIFASRDEFASGVRHATKCLTAMGECQGRYPARLQPYGVYVPRRQPPAAGYGLTILMHGLSANYNEFLGSRHAEQFGDRGSGSIVASPQSRGPDGQYKSHAEADVFEMWADVARRYPLDATYVSVGGYSMGGGGTYRLTTRWPDLFARAFPIVAPATSDSAEFRSLRNVPTMAWYGGTDELVNPALAEQAFVGLQAAGIRFEHWSFVPAGHITLGNNDEYAPAARFLGDHRVDRDPPHVTYVVAPSKDFGSTGRADHAYWLSGLRTRGEDEGTIDARSSAFGVADAPVGEIEASNGTLEGGSHGPIPYARRARAWGPAPAAAKANRLDVTATGITEATVDVARARLGCDADVRVKADGPLKLTLAGCDTTMIVPKGTSKAGCLSRRSFTIRIPKRLRGRRVLSARVLVEGKRVRVKRRRATVDLRRRPRGRFTIRIAAKLTGGRRATQVRRYRTCVPRRS